MMDREIKGLLVVGSPVDAALLREHLAGSRPAAPGLQHAERLQDGLDLLHLGTVDVVLLALPLPDAGGVEAVTRTQAARPDVAIIVLVGLNDEALATRAVQEGAQDFLIKGQMDGNLLVRAILHARERKRAERVSDELVRARAALASAEQAERNARLLADAGRILASSLDHDATLSSMTCLSVPAVADCCLADLLRENGEIDRVAALSVDGEMPELWRDELGALPPGDDPVSRALRPDEGSEVTVLAELPEDARRALRLPERWSRFVPGSAAIIRLLARGNNLGTMTFLAGSRGSRTRLDAVLAQDLASLAALAADNARLHRGREQVLELVSHDLRTPMTALQANLSLIVDFQAPPRGPLEVISRSTRQMSYLVDDLLDATRLERGTFALDRQPVDVGALLQEVADALRSSAKVRGLQLEVLAAPGLPEVNADQHRLLQVLWNLVGNSIKFTPAGGRVDLRGEATEKELRLEVSDTGPGIPEAQLPNVFRRFWQGRPGDRRGVGLGLSIAKAIVEAHGGKIGVRSSKAGTTFFFTLPRTSAPRDTGPESPPAREGPIR